jgi:hypothetical protein
MRVSSFFGMGEPLYYMSHFQEFDESRGKRIGASSQKCLEKALPLLGDVNPMIYEEATDR